MSEGIDALVNELGFAGYGRWNRLLEIVASKMDETDRCHAEYSIQKWCSFLGLKQKKLISFLELTENKLKTKVVYYENKIRIEIPNLLKKRDNYTKHLEVKSKQLASIDIEVEVDKEKDKKKEKEKKLSIPKDIFGEHKNVRLTKNELDKLLNLVGKLTTDKYIEALSDYIESNGRRYKNHYATLRGWLRRDGLLKPEKKQETLSEEEKTQIMYEQAKKNPYKEIGDLADSWRGLHKKYPKMGWDGLLRERGIQP